MLSVMEKDGAIYGLPAEIFCNGIWYNKALFDQCGLEIPVTYEDLMNCVKVSMKMELFQWQEEQRMYGAAGPL